VEQAYAIWKETTTLFLLRYAYNEYGLVCEPRVAWPSSLGSGSGSGDAVRRALPHGEGAAPIVASDEDEGRIRDRPAPFDCFEDSDRDADLGKRRYQAFVSDGNVETSKGTVFEAPIEESSPSSDSGEATAQSNASRAEEEKDVVAPSAGATSFAQKAAATASLKFTDETVPVPVSLSQHARVRL
jgi:hypothetical protein